MFSHGPSCLRGPLGRAREWWAAATEGQVTEPSTRAAFGPIPSDDPGHDERPFRADLVERVRREIDQGTYETPEKMEIALDRLMRRLDEE